VLVEVGILAVLVVEWYHFTDRVDEDVSRCRTKKALEEFDKLANY
jgi:hypothetical protein